MQPEQIVDVVCQWYAENARDLPWRDSDVTAWGVMVSEFMLQQTPVARVLGPWRQWLDRWPTASALAAEQSRAAVAAWGRLGYPRRALRLHQAACIITTEYSGNVPCDVDELRRLPDVGEYTAAAISSFAYGQQHLVLDTNVRRVLSRIDDGIALPALHLTNSERDNARRYLASAGNQASTWAAASMELGATVCLAKNPMCDACPVVWACRWQAAGAPEAPDTRKRVQSWEGTDRQCRGLIIAALREADAPVPKIDLVRLWPDTQRVAVLIDDLVSEGLVRHDSKGYML